MSRYRKIGVNLSAADIDADPNLNARSRHYLPALKELDHTI